MQKVDRKERRSRPGLRRTLLGVSAAAAVVLAVALVWILGHPRWMSDLLPGVFPAPTAVPTSTPTPRPVLLTEHEPGEAVGVDVTLRGGEHWSVGPAEGGGLELTGDLGTFPVGAAKARWLTEALVSVWHAEVLADRLADLGDEPSAFGLEPPLAVVRVTLEDGAEAVFRLGSLFDGDDERFYYMTMDGDPRLFAIDVTTGETLGFGAAQLIDLAQPVLHPSRMDRIAVEDASGRRVWALDGAITDPFAIEHWSLTEPAVYPADGEAVSALKTAVGELRLVGYVGAATEERLAECGLAEPEAVITVHLSPGLTFEGIDWPESEVTIAVGGRTAALQRYVLYEGTVYEMLDFRLRAVLDTRPADTLSHYPVLTPLTTLERLTRTDASGETVWHLDREASDSRSPRVTVTGAGGGETMAWGVFEARYGSLLTAAVDGALPADFTPGEPHTVWRFATVDGAEHTIALADFDGAFDAVIVDGSALFYMRKGALSMDRDAE